MAMKAWLTCLIGALSMDLVAFASGPHVVVGVSNTGPAVDVAALRERIAAILEREQVPGAGIAIASANGVVWTGGVGLADVAQGRPADGQTPFRLGSVTKNVTALAVMQQVELGHLSLDSRLQAVAPEVPFDNPWEDAHPITIANLLEHTAGFDLFRFNDDYDYGPAPRPLLEALRVNPQARRSRWPPGTRTAYSNEGYNVAGYILEKVAGRALDDVVHDGVFGPLGMRNSALRLTPALGRTLARGYGPRQREAVYVEDMQRSAANLIASADDMARYLQMWLGRGKVDGRSVLSADGIARMERRATLPYTGPDADYGLGTDTAQYGGFVAHGHTGITDGFSASFRYFPREGVGWVVMLNALPSGDALPEIETELVDFLMQGSTPPAPAEAPATDPARFAGYYRDAAPTQEILAALSDTFGGTEVQVRADGLWERTHVLGGLRSLVSQEPWRRLIAVGSEGSFRHDDEVVSTRSFTGAEAGVTALVTPMGYFEQSPLWLADLKRIVLLGSLACLMSTPVLVAVSIARAFGLTSTGFLGGPPPTLTQVPTILLVLIAAAAWAILSRSPERLSEMNATTVALFAASTLFPFVALLTVGTAIRASFYDDVGLVFKAYLLLVAAAGGALSVFAWSAHWVALRTWAW